jgi:uncharacterized repeat protein (TIGR02543 family)
MMYRFSFLFGLFALLIFSACQDPFAPQKPATIPAGKGSFSLSVAVARTILPAVPYEDALWYRFDFKPSPTGTIMQEDRDYTELADPFYLEPGTYSLTVTAYSDAGRTNPVVQGNSTNNIVIIEGESTGATIVLRAIVASGTGTFIYTVGIPESVSSATITITPWGETSPIINDPMDKNTGEGTYNLAAGYYHVRFILLKENENGETLTWAEILHIYSNLESSFAMNFTDADFYKTIYTVTFEYNDGSPEGVGSAFHGGKVTMPIQDLTRENYAFGGWYRDPACTGSPYDFDLPVINNITLYAKWIEKAVITIIITVEQMTDLSFDDIDGGTIYRNGSPTSIEFEYKDADTGSYTCEWTIDGVGAYAGLIPLTTGSSYTVSATDPRYNSPGKHPVYLKVVKNGVPYKKAIWVEIVDFEPVPATGVTLSPTSLSLVVGGTVTLSSDFEPVNATNRNVTWTSNNDAVATVTDGVVSAVSVGNATITVTTEDGDHTANCAVKVSASPILVSDVTLNKTALALAVGGTETLSATVAPADATDKAVNWSISPPGIAEVSKGRVTGFAAGSATVTVTTVDGGHTATCAVTVTASSNLNDIDFGFDAALPQTINVANATQWNNAKTTIADGGNDKNYIINVTGNFNVAGSTDSTFGTATGITVSLRAASSRTLTLTGTGNMIRTRANQTVILRDITMKGNGSNNNSVVYVGTNGAFVMHSGEISGNTITSSVNFGGGVYVFGFFDMHGGKISGNTVSGSAGGVCVSSNAIFTMYGGEISGNTGDMFGGGVCVFGTFTMHGGTISGNIASRNIGGGVCVNSGTLRLRTGTIYGSNASPASLRNTAPLMGSGAALGNEGTASSNYGPDGTGTDLVTTNNTIRVVNGIMQ